MTRGDAQCFPEQCEQPVTAGASAGDSDSDSNCTQSSEPGIEPRDCRWSEDLGVVALDGEVNGLLHEANQGEGSESPLPMFASTSEGPRGSEYNGNRIESTNGTSTWYKGNYHSSGGRSSV